MLCVRACVQARRQVTEREMGHAHDGIHTTSLVLIARTRTELTAHPRHIIIAARYGMRLLAISRQLIFRGGHAHNSGQHIGPARALTVVRAGFFARSDKERSSAMQYRREKRLVDSAHTTVHSSAYDVHTFLLPFSFHLIAEGSHAADD